MINSVISSLIHFIVISFLLEYSLVDMYARIINKLEIDNQDQGNEETVMKIIRIDTGFVTEQ